MQPYFFPYIGYFQLIAATDQFVIYDNVKYTKKGWINRNRFILNGKDSIFTIPLTKDSDFLDVRDRRISPEYQREKLIRQLEAAYRRAPQFDKIFPEIVEIINHDSDNLFEYIHHSAERLCRLLGIEAKFIISSHVPIDHSLIGQDKVLAICRRLGADQYINTIGGVELYSRQQFHAFGIDLKFIKTKPIVYAQFNNDFIPNLSIIDVLMFNPLDKVKQWVRLDYDLI
jgi:hypothetical protein